MNRKELNKAFKEKLITRKVYAEKLIELEQTPKKVRKASRIYDPVNMDEFGKLLKVTKNPRHRLSFILGQGAGLRVSEIVGGVREDGTHIMALVKDNVDMKTKIIMVRNAKGKKDRRTMVPKWFKEKHLKELPIELGERALQKAFLRNSMKCSINKIIDYYDRKNKKGNLVKVPIYRLKFHSLRRGFASHCLRIGIPTNQVAAMMGHTNLSTTTKYTKSKVEDEIENIVEAWDKN